MEKIIQWISEHIIATWIISAIVSLALTFAVIIGTIYLVKAILF